MNSRHDCVRSYTSLELCTIGDDPSITLSPIDQQSTQRPAFVLAAVLGLQRTMEASKKHAGRNHPSQPETPYPHLGTLTASSAYCPMASEACNLFSTVSEGTVSEGGGLLNIRSVSNKIESISDLSEDYKLNFLTFTEKWHEDSDSVAMRQL